ncbi:MAG TPA: alpha-ketoglutarate-dependent dioxygenase AlkB, partial [Propionibacteriaceae bacterium]|nr:alpha-ketoglutarate-dependent dioxygenase AlkB [Propionibacteriaceae bacterium]
MSAAIQTSLFDAAAEVAFGSLKAGLVRQELGRGAWVDVLPGWMTGADDLFDSLLSDIDWIEERRQMYERVVLVPRLLRFYGEDEMLPDP